VQIFNTSSDNSAIIIFEILYLYREVDGASRRGTLGHSVYTDVV